MNRLLLVLPLLLWTKDILRAQQPEGHVLVREPIVVLVRRFDLAEKCGTTKKIEACTAFVGQRLSCRCEPSGDGWKLAASAQFIPVMYLLGPAHVLHERDHIDDVERSLRAYLGDLQALRFDSAEACQREAAARADSFTRTMDRFKEDSNVMRHRGYHRKLPIITEARGSSSQRR